MRILPRLALTWGANAFALLVANDLLGGVRLHGWAAYLVASFALAAANAVLKPLLTVLTLPLIVLTLGFFYLLINVAMVAFAAWVAPNFTVSGFWDYVGVVLLVWLVNWAFNGVAASRQPAAAH